MLTKVPKKLGNVYKHILSEVINKKDIQQTLCLIQYIFLAKQPLTVTEECFAICLPDTEILALEFSLKELGLLTHNIIVRQIVSLSKGLIES
jgi:hypothetical protein